MAMSKKSTRFSTLTTKEEYRMPSAEPCSKDTACSSVTNRNEEINQHLKNVSITPVYVELKKLNEWAGNGQFDPSHLVFLSVKKEVSTAAVVKGLEHICPAPNSNLVRNADGLLSSRAAENSVDWIDESKVRIPHQKFKVSC